MNQVVNKQYGDVVSTVIDLFNKNPSHFSCVYHSNIFSPDSDYYIVKYRPTGLEAKVLTHKAITKYEAGVVTISNARQLQVSIEGMGMTEHETKMLIGTFKPYFELKKEKLKKAKHRRKLRDIGVDMRKYI